MHHPVTRPGALLALATGLALFPALAGAEVFVRCDGVPGDRAGPGGRNDYFIADSFSFGVEREMKESGEKGGTEDINIGVGELQECTISKSLDASSATLAQFAVNGNSAGSCTLLLADPASGQEPGKPYSYLAYKLDRAFVKSWSTSGDADDRPTEEVAFYYNRIAFAYLVDDGSDSLREEAMSWDNVRHRPWPDGVKGLTDLLDGPLPGPAAD